MSPPLTASSLTTTPYALYAITSRLDANTPQSKGGIANAANRDAIQQLCPYTGSNLTGRNRNSLRVSPSASSSFGIRCLLPLPAATTTTTNPPPDDPSPPAAFVGHGGSSRRDDDRVFLLAPSTKWKVRPPEPLTPSPQSAAVDGGRYLVLSCASGNCYLYSSWTAEDNLVAAWRAHHRAATCCAFDGSGSTVFTGGEDGTVNAWCLLDLLERGGGGGGGRTISPFCTWSEHALPVAWIHVCKGGGGGAGGGTRLISCSLDRYLIVMEMGSEARVLARMCLPSGLHCVVADSLESRLYAAAADGNIYCVDMDAYAIHETMDGGGTVVRVDRTENVVGADLESILVGNHVGPRKRSLARTSADRGRYVSEWKGHIKAVLSLALLDPSELASTSLGSETAPSLLASGSEDGTVRIWDLRSRSCVRVLRPWAPTSEGTALHSSASAGTSPPVTGLVAVPKASFVCSNATLAMGSAVGSHRGGRSGHSMEAASIFKPLKRFVRGSSVDRDKTGTDSSSPSEDCCLVIRPRRGDVSFWGESIHDFTFYRQSKKART